MSIRATNLVNLTHFASTQQRDRDGRTVIDLEEARFIDPYGLVAIACHVIEAHAKDQDIQVLTPYSPRVATYLSRMNFPSLCEAFDLDVDWPFPDVLARDHHHDLLELQPFTSYESIEKLANLVFHNLEGHIDPQALVTLFDAVGELGANVIEHSAGPNETGVGIICAQMYKRGDPEEFLVLAVADLGIGMKRALKRHKPANNQEAVGLALKRNVSGTDDAGRGQGLPEVIEQVTGLKGRVHVRSGTAEARLSGTARSGQIKRYRSVIPLGGTIVGARIPCRPGATGSRGGSR